LAELGFRPGGPANSFYRIRGEGLFDCISVPIDYGPEDKSMACTVNVGIGCLDGQARSGSTDFSRRKCALTWNIGYLMSGRKWLEWGLFEQGGIEGNLDEISQSIESIAIPWLERFATPGDVRREQNQNQPRGFDNLKRTAKRRTWAG
jgi:hypothetical protein